MKYCQNNVYAFILKRFLLLVQELSTCWMDVRFLGHLVYMTAASDDERLMLLEALFIKELAPGLNTKDEFRSRNLSLKF